jgi:hypothetical protein
MLAVAYTNLINIKGLETYIESHPRAVAEKERIRLKNNIHFVDIELYVAETLVG